jgi:hypothetical protein
VWEKFRVLSALFLTKIFVKRKIQSKVAPTLHEHKNGLSTRLGVS